MGRYRGRQRWRSHNAIQHKSYGVRLPDYQGLTQIDILLMWWSIAGPVDSTAIVRNNSARYQPLHARKGPLRWRLMASKDDTADSAQVASQRSLNACAYSRTYSRAYAHVRVTCTRTHTYTRVRVYARTRPRHPQARAYRKESRGPYTAALSPLYNQ